MEANGMDILFRAKWRKPHRGSDCDRLNSSSGLSRLLLALAIIAAIVVMLDRAASTTDDDHAPPNHPGELP
jgi:hypothetical protein